MVAHRWSRRIQWEKWCALEIMTRFPKRRTNCRSLAWMTRPCTASLFQLLYLPLIQRGSMIRFLMRGTAQGSSWTDRLDSVTAGKVHAMATAAPRRDASERSVNLARTKTNIAFRRPKGPTLEATTVHSLKTICFTHQLK